MEQKSENRLIASADKKIEQWRQELERSAECERGINKILTMLSDEGFTINEAQDMLFNARSRVGQIIGKTKFADTVTNWYASHDASQND